MGLNFQVVNPNLLVITLFQMQLPALMKKTKQNKTLSPKTFRHLVAIAKEYIVGDLSVREPETYGLHFLLNEHGLQNEGNELIIWQYPV